MSKKKTVTRIFWGEADRSVLGKYHIVLVKYKKINAVRKKSGGKWLIIILVRNVDKVYKIFQSLSKDTIQYMGKMRLNIVSKCWMWLTDCDRKRLNLEIKLFYSQRFLPFCSLGEFSLPPSWPEGRAGTGYPPRLTRPVPRISSSRTATWRRKECGPTTPASKRIPLSNRLIIPLILRRFQIIQRVRELPVRIVNWLCAVSGINYYLIIGSRNVSKYGTFSRFDIKMRPIHNTGSDKKTKNFLMT
jgi:hypothetical protein